MSRPIRQIDRFAELLADHDTATGNSGGNAANCARRLGLRPENGNALLQRMRRELGRQAV